MLMMMAISSVVHILLLLGTCPSIHGQAQSTIELEKRVETLERRGREQHDLMASLLQRLDSQSQQLQSQSQMLEKQQLILQRHDRESEELRSTIRSQSVRIKDQEKALQKMRKYSDAVVPSQDDLNMRDGIVLNSTMPSDSSKHGSGNKDAVHPRHRSTKETGHTSRLAQTREAKLPMTPRKDLDNVRSKRLALDNEGPVAFHAVIDKIEVAHIGINQNIVFDVVLENIGGAYHNQHGVFIAPVNGVYIFSVSIMSYINNHPEVQVDLKKDGVTLAKAFGHGDNGRHDQGSVTVVTQLSQGNEVWVSLEYPNDDSILGERFSSFMGCLVYPL